MSDEFDDALDAEVLRQGAATPATAKRQARPLAARLVSRLYAGASTPLRVGMLACLLRPLSPLGLVAVASGAFAVFLHRGGDRGAWVMLEDAGRYSNEQIFELARFVEQVSPEALQQLGSLISASPVGTAAFSVSAAMLLLRYLRRTAAPGSLADAEVMIAQAHPDATRRP
jgi:hypothetical protein